MRIAFVTLSIAAALTQAGCVTTLGTPSYPASWATIKTAPTPEGCPNLQGTYTNQVRDAVSAVAGKPPSLEEIFTEMTHSTGGIGVGAMQGAWPIIRRDSVAVSIEQGPGTMTISFIDSAGNQTPLRFRNYRSALSKERFDDLFICRTLYSEPSLRFFLELESNYGPWRSLAVVMLRSIDGSLIVALQNPLISGSMNRWYRYSHLTGEIAPSQ